jgi:hypothetical protein
MRNLLALFALLVLLFVGIGWFKGWYRVERTDSAPGKQSYNVEVDTNKIRHDVHQTGERLYNAIEDRKDNTPKTDNSQSDPGKSSSHPLAS